MARPDRKLERGDWLRRALEVLEEGGLDRIRIQALARDLGITRGSFYWHFKDRADLLNSLLEYWEIALTDSVILAMSGTERGPRDALFALMEDVAINERSRYDMAFLAWAKVDADVRKRVEGVFRRRRTFVTRLFREMGFPAPEADARGQLVVEQMFGRSGVRWGDSRRRIRGVLRRQWKVLTEGATEG